MGYIKLKVIPVFRNKLFYPRYVDDCFVLVSSEKIMNEFFNILNTAHNSISFTMEKENNNEFAFLDVQVKREENIFLTLVCRKKTFTDLFEFLT